MTDIQTKTKSSTAHDLFRLGIALREAKCSAVMWPDSHGLFTLTLDSLSAEQVVAILKSVDQVLFPDSPK